MTTRPKEWQFKSSYPRFREDTSTPRTALPPGSWDTAFHVFTDPARLPYVEGRDQFGPQPEATYDKLLKLHATLGIDRGVMVQSLAYGTDHRVMLEALAEGDGRYVGVALIDRSMKDQEFADLKAAGFVGARFNLASWLVGPPSDQELLWGIDRVSELGWNATVHVDPTVLLEREAILQSIEGVPVVIDHLAHFKTSLGLDHPALDVLQRLLAKENYWIRLSNADRCSSQEEGYTDTIELIRRIHEMSPERSVWATDWPHPFYQKETMVDDGAMVDLLATAIPDEAARNAVLVDNAARLYG
jgi:predicted TIM-barrel fold metal-dependent hydrolase